MSVPSNAHTPRLGSLFGAITSAMQPARMPLAFLLALLVPVLASLVDRLDGGRPVAMQPDGWIAIDSDRLFASFPQTMSASAPRGVFDDQGIERPKGVGTAFLAECRLSLRQAAVALVRLDAKLALQSLRGALIDAPARAVRAAPLASTAALLVGLAASSVVAGGLCRMAAVHAGRRARLTVLEGAAYARERALRLAALPVLPAMVVALLALPILLFAVLLRVPALDILAGALFVVPVLVALLGAILAAVSVAAFPLMPAAVAVEDCDSGDAITRAASLALSRPLLWLSILGVGAVTMFLGGAIVSAVIGLAGWALSELLVAAGGDFGKLLATGTTAQLESLEGTRSIAATALDLWAGLFRLLCGAYLVSLFFDLSTRAYLLMRARIDGEPPATVSGYGVG
ncbi:MAG: hypothetical protein GC172_04345 [Phycisphaera sp.]|nr:hypothetical protein [Phycisphaera sp.]